MLRLLLARPPPPPRPGPVSPPGLSPGHPAAGADRPPSLPPPSCPADRRRAGPGPGADSRCLTHRQAKAHGANPSGSGGGAAGGAGLSESKLALLEKAREKMLAKKPWQAAAKTVRRMSAQSDASQDGAGPVQTPAATLAGVHTGATGKPKGERVAHPRRRGGGDGLPPTGRRAASSTSGQPISPGMNSQIMTAARDKLAATRKKEEGFQRPPAGRTTTLLNRRQAGAAKGEETDDSDSDDDDLYGTRRRRGDGASTAAAPKPAAAAAAAAPQEPKAKAPKPPPVKAEPASPVDTKPDAENIPPLTPTFNADNLHQSILETLESTRSIRAKVQSIKQSQEKLALGGSPVDTEAALTVRRRLKYDKRLGPSQLLETAQEGKKSSRKAVAILKGLDSELYEATKAVQSILSQFELLEQQCLALVETDEDGE